MVIINMSRDTGNGTIDAGSRFIVARNVQVRPPVLYGNMAFDREDAMRRAEELNHGIWPLGELGWGVYNVKEAGKGVPASIKTFLGGGSYAVGNPTAHGGFYLPRRDGVVPVFGRRASAEEAAARTDLRILVLTPVV